MTDLTKHPFAKPVPAAMHSVAIAGAESREIAMVQARFAVAHTRGRDEPMCVARIAQLCETAELADDAEYCYTRGENEIRGASIVLATAIKNVWGHIDAGYEHLGSDVDSVLLRAYAIDYLTNDSHTVQFRVRHWRDTKSGGYAVKSERDKYEIEANAAMRRVRACILNVIPRWVADGAVEVCRRTNERQAAMGAKVEEVLRTAAKFGVNGAMIEGKFGKPRDKLDHADVAKLGSILRAIRDGITSIETEFRAAPAPQPAGHGARDVTSKREDPLVKKGVETTASPASKQEGDPDHPQPSSPGELRTNRANIESDLDAINRAESFNQMILAQLESAESFTQVEEVRLRWLAAKNDLENPGAVVSGIFEHLRQRIHARAKDFASEDTEQHDPADAESEERTEKFGVWSIQLIGKISRSFDVAAVDRCHRSALEVYGRIKNPGKAAKAAMLAIHEARVRRTQELIARESGDADQTDTALATDYPPGLRKNDDGNWVDSAGTVYDPDMHGWNNQTGFPSLTKAKRFRRRRGGMAKAQTQKSGNGQQAASAGAEMPSFISMARRRLDGCESIDQLIEANDELSSVCPPELKPDYEALMIKADERITRAGSTQGNV